MRAKLPLFCLIANALLACDPATVSSTPDEDAPGPAEGGEGGEGAGDPYEGALAPVAKIDAADGPRVGEPFSLDGAGSYDPQGFEITGYAWACSDGSAREGAVASFTFVAEGPVSCALTVTSASGLSGTASRDLSVERPLASWTIMVFMNGDNELEGAALEDMNELEAAGSTDAVNLMVQIDRSANYDRSDGNWTGARRYRVERDDTMSAISSPVLMDLGTTDSGSVDSVVDFVAWAAQNYPAERYALVLWDHGWSWSVAPTDPPYLTKGISSDYSSGNDISVAEGELEELLDGVVGVLGQRLSIMGFDACTMAGWEIAYATMPYAEVLVGSQDYESEDGWSYDETFGDLIASPDMDAAELGERIALRFNETKDSTQSAIDLGRLTELNAALDTLADTLMDRSDVGSLMSEAARASLDFEGGRGVDRDLGELLDNLAAGLDDDAAIAEAATARAVLDEIVLSNYTYGRAAAGATGLCIYAPTRGTVADLYLKGSWSDGSLWDDLLVAAHGTR